MPRYIDAYEFRREIDEYYPFDKETQERHNEFDIAKSALLLILSIQPTADVVPVKRGHWVAYPACLAYDGAYSETHIVCSECTHVWNIMDNDTETFNYCPNCGGKME